MRFENVFIPYGAYWSSPFSRWEKKLAGANAIEFAADVAARALSERGIAPDAFDSLFLGLTVPQPGAFYGAPWLAARMGAPEITGPTLAQACATSVRAIASAGFEIETGAADAILAVCADRTSAGPRIWYPDPREPERETPAENWMRANFERDPYSGISMISTAENVARAEGIGRREQEEITLVRYRQYADALADGRSFQRRYMVAPIELANGAGRLEGDFGVYPTTAESLAALEVRVPGGTITVGTMTYPADGNAGLVLASRERALALSRDPRIEVRLLSFGQARVEKGLMPKATVPAARRALERAGLRIEDMTAVKTHNPFAVNDVYFCRSFELAPEAVNRYGSPLVWGHPQAPTGMRATIELIEELAIKGGGYGLFSGCAGGDSAAALVVRVAVK
ncbi:MAG: thiolase family protein [Planctomycetes bacterium]|nr:thiolase family protein [Planctomycetota bacterium]